MNETTSMTHVLGAHDGGTHRTPCFEGAGIGPIELWREGLRFRRDASGRGLDRRPGVRSPGFAGPLRTSSELDDDNAGFEERASREGCPPSAPRIAAALLLARAFDAAPDAARDLVSGGAPVVVDVADGAVLDALRGEWRGMFFDDPFRLIDLVRIAPGRRSALDGAYIMLKEPPKGSAKERLERVAADMCG
jgi:cell division protease FtsH